jgi:hypothetical protein
MNFLNRASPNALIQFEGSVSRWSTTHSSVKFWPRPLAARYMYHAASIVMCLKEMYSCPIVVLCICKPDRFIFFCTVTWKFICEFSIIYEPPTISPHEWFEYSGRCSIEIYTFFCALIS